MILSPSRQQMTQQSGEDVELEMSGIDGPSTEGVTSSSSATTTASPQYGNANGSHNRDVSEGGTVHSSSHPHHFNIETFDFGADFSLPTSLDELTIFQIQQNGSSGPNSTGSRSIRGPPSSDGVSGSPHNLNFSPRSNMQEQHVHAAGVSRTQSPHPLSMSTNDLSAINEHGNAGHINNSDLHNLLLAVQNSSVPGQQYQHQGGHQRTESAGGEERSLSLTELEKILTEKEQTERVQSVQNAFLRQQLDSLRRQQEQQQQSTSSRSSEGHTPTTLSVGASQLMQQFQQLSSQQSASTPTPQNPQYPPFAHQQHAQSLSESMGTPSDFASQPQKLNMSSMSQYGLITPLSSGAFSHQGSQPFVSPIHLPSSSQAGAMEAHRAYDPHMSNGTFTPLESPAITPASVFSTVGSSNMTSQDMFSPLTSPALRPHMGSVSEDMMLPPSASPYHGPSMPRGRAKSKGKASPHFGPQGKKAAMASGSPLAAPVKSVPRKNRSTTAEARANRARPSPLIKPTSSSTPSATAVTANRKRTESINGLPSPLGHTVTNGSHPIRKHSQSEDLRDRTNFAPLLAGTGSTKPMDASPSEGAASTPSPIDLNTSSQGKPITPGSIMGIVSGTKNGSKSSSSSTETRGKARTSEAAAAAAAASGKQVSFAAGQQSAQETSPGALQSIQPGGFPAADREAWLSIKSGGGLESRRTSHKAAEQKRRDSLKFCFDELRGMLPAITLDDDAPGGSSLGADGLVEDQEAEEFEIEEVGDAESARIANRAISKVALLRHSNEYLIRLKNRLDRRDAHLNYYRSQVVDLRARLGYPPMAEDPAMLASHAPMHIDDSHFDHNLAANHMDVT